MKKLVFAVLAVCFVFVSSAAMADPEEGSVDSKGAEARNKVLDAAQEFTKDLDRMSTRHFNVLYGNYNLIKVVETVRDDVSEAVDACGEANPELKDKLETRYGEWKDAVNPVLKEADANVNNMVIAQDYANPVDIRKFLKMIDETREKQEKEIEKVPVTSVEACQSLLMKMDGTQNQMTKLLQMTLVSLPLMMQAEDEKVKAEAEAKAAEEEARKKEAEEKAQDEQKEL